MEWTWEKEEYMEVNATFFAIMSATKQKQPAKKWGQEHVHLSTILLRILRRSLAIPRFVELAQTDEFHPEVLPRITQNIQTHIFAGKMTSMTCVVSDTGTVSGLCTVWIIEKGDSSDSGRSAPLLSCPSVGRQATPPVSRSSSIVGTGI